MVSIIIPTYNEAENIITLLVKIQEVLSAAGIGDYEILVMDDDSPDGTAAKAAAMGKREIRAVNRKGKKKGLSEAVIDGFGQARGDIIGVMDADMSNPPELLPQLIAAAGKNEVAVASRYVPGGGVRNWPLKRRIASRVAGFLAYGLTPARDPLSGYFFFRRNVIEGIVLDPLGFKIGLEVLAKGRHRKKIGEVPYFFTDRTKGLSKAGPRVMLSYLKQLYRLYKTALTTEETR